MKFNSHKSIHGKHALLSPSSYHWINYTEQKLKAKYLASTQAALGVALHDFAQKAIQLGIKQPKSKKTIYQYINDAIGFKMKTEQPLYYSDNCFGTADAISFRNGTLRIHDLKTGIIPSSMHQLEVYAALFCLEYSISPYEITIILRIYQNDDIKEAEPHPDVIADIMDTIIDFDRKIEIMKEEGFGEHRFG